MITPTETERCRLRIVETADKNEIYRLLSDSEIVENLNLEIHKTIADTENMIDNYLEEYNVGTKYPFVILEKDTGKFIGVFLIKLDLYDEDCFEYTVYLDKKYWGKGICTEIMPYMEKVAFEEINTGNFRGFIMEKNIASEKVLQKCGFKLEKIFEVPGIVGKIKSYWKTKEEYMKSCR